MTSRLTILTVATKPDGYYDILVQTCKDLGLNLVVVGLGKQWQGWTKRLEWVYEAMKKVPLDETVLVCDAYDVFFLASHEEILQKYKSLNCKLLVGGDSQGNQPVQQFFSEVFFNQTDCQYSNKEYYLVCAGTFITSPRFFCEEVYSDLHTYTEKYNDDQTAFTSLALLHPEKVTIDHNCVLFQTIFPCPGKDIMKTYNLEWHGKRLYNKTFSTYPILVHGGGFTNLCPFTQVLYPGVKCKVYSLRDQWKKTLSYAPATTKVIVVKYKYNLYYIVILLFVLYWFFYGRFGSNRYQYI